MSRPTTAAVSLVTAVLLCSACAPDASDRTVLFEQCTKEKDRSTQVCQCIVDAEMKHYDKDVLRVFVARAQGRHAEADRLMASIPVSRSSDQIMKLSFATADCIKGGGN